ncbi:hypothetical protein SASPL_130806 [Salvia splendens]|uniref:F-box domain-containing protein n=1 Tax=Salvia splendens TaxID=180675 RepID=A0A8X8ZJS1_SALSN|nr:F-box only protein 6-like [Salvia splendens]KAG6407807.1 hypothetical protein SASPL_130806 [Salvia splendens]
MVESGKTGASRKKGRKERRGGFGKADEIMEGEIWKDFPEDLFESLLARVPIATFFRFRSVCRKWNSLLTSQSFSQQYGEVEHSKPWFYAITYEDIYTRTGAMYDPSYAITYEDIYTRTGAMYDPSSNKWHHPTMPDLPTKVIKSPVASAGGLICFVDFHHKSIYVCNPLTRSFKELPARCGKPMWDDAAVRMTQTRNESSLFSQFAY